MNYSSRPVALRYGTGLTCVGLTLLATSSLADFPSSILLDIEHPDGIAEPIAVYIDGQETFNYQYIEDMDGDQRPELLIKGVGPEDSASCRNLYLAPSTLTDQTRFTTEELNTLVRYEGFKTFFDGGCLSSLTRDVVSLGDINGDGLGDLYYGSLTDEDDSTGFILYGNVSAGSVIDLQTSNASTHVLSYAYLAPAGDMDADGLADVYFGFYSPGIIRGSAITGDIFAAAAFEPEDYILTIVPDSETYFFEMQAAGDVNGDGVDDALFMTYNRDGYFMVEGAAGLQLRIEGDDELIARDIPMICEQKQNCNIGPVGDFDGDGYDDLASYIGVLHGSASGIALKKDVSDLSEAGFTRFSGGFPLNALYSGYQAPDRIRPLGDFNQDGVDDLLFLSRNDTAIVLFGVAGDRPATYSTGILDGSNGFVADLNYNKLNIYLSPINPLIVADHDGDDRNDLILFGQAVVHGQPQSDAPAAPTEVRARYGYGTTDILWSAPVDSSDVTGYEISLNGAIAGSVDADSFQLTLDSVANPADNKNPPIYSVTALGSNGQRSATVTRYFAYGPVGSGSPALFDGSPSISWNERPVKGLSVDVYGPELVELSWDETPGRFFVYRDNELMAAVRGNSYIDNSINSGQTYSWFVTRGNGPAIDDSDTTVASGYDCSVPCRPAEASFLSVGRSERVEKSTTQDPVDPVETGVPTPAGLRVDVYSSTDVELFWDRASRPLTTYDVYRNGEMIADGIYGLSVFETHLSPGTDYEFTVIANVHGDLSAPASILVNTTGSTGPVDTGSATPRPTGGRSAVYSTNNLEIFWDRSDAAFTTYDVYRDDELIRRGMSGLSVFDTQLTPGTTYTYSVVAKLDGIDSDPLIITATTNEE